MMPDEHAEWAASRQALRREAAQVKGMASGIDTFVTCAYCGIRVLVGEMCSCITAWMTQPGVTSTVAADIAAARNPDNWGKPSGTRVFDTGGLRSSDSGRYDPEGALSPLVLERFCQYMEKHCVLSDGSTRTSDNWQKGMPRDSYMKGLLRHVLHAWSRHRGHEVRDAKATDNLEEDLLAALFNIQGYLFELLLKR